MIQFDDHRNYVNRPTGQKYFFLGGNGDELSTGTDISNSESVVIVNKNNKDSDNVIVESLKAGFDVDAISTWDQIKSFCKTYNSDYAGVTHTSDNIIFCGSTNVILCVVAEIPYIPGNPIAPK